jgi:hypothetical protein
MYSYEYIQRSIGTIRFFDSNEIQFVLCLIQINKHEHIGTFDYNEEKENI